MADPLYRILDANKLMGTWLLVALEGQAEDGEVWQLHGPEPIGQIMYDASGYMAVIFMRANRPHLPEDDYLSGSADQLKAAFQSFEAYAGTYSLDTTTHIVTHHVRTARLPNWVGGDQVRYIEKLTDEELHLGTPPLKARGKEWRLSIRWARPLNSSDK